MKVKNKIGFSKPCLLLAVLLTAAVTFAVIADSDESDAWLETRGTVGGVDWFFYGETLELSPSDNPAEGYERGQMGPAKSYFWVENYPNRGHYVLEELIVHEGVLNISEESFYNVCYGGIAFDVGLHDVSLPSSLESIGKKAFWGCIIYELTIPENVKSIGDEAFAGNNIEKMTVKACVPPQMNSNALKDNRISEILVPSESLEAYKAAPGWSSYAHLIKPMDFVYTSSDGAWTYSKGTLTLSKNSALAWNEAFPSLPAVNVKSAIVESGATSIGEKAFKGCASLTSVEIKGDVFIGSYAFSGTNLESLKVDGAIVGQGIHIFEDVITFKTITISKGIASPEPGIFRHQVFLTSVDLGTSGVTTEITGMMFAECSGLKTIVIPYGVTKIDSYAFQGCASLTDVGIPDTVKEIGVSAFNSCGKLTSVEIPSSVETVGIKAFAYCGSLKNVVIGEGVETIGKEAFLYCTSLEQLTVGKNVKTIGEDIVLKCTNLKSLWFDCMTNGNGFDKYAFEISTASGKASMPGLTVYYRTGSPALDLPIADYKTAVAKYSYTWLDQDGKVLQEDKDLDSIDLPPYGGETPKMDGKTFAGWASIYEGMGKTTLTPVFTDGEMDDIGGDDGQDKVGPFEKVKNWIKDKAKAIVDKLKGMFSLPKFYKI